MTPQRNERAFALLRVDALLRARPFLSVCSDRPEARSPRTIMSLAGDFSLAFSTDPQFCTALQAWLRSRLRCAPTALHWTRTLALSRLHRDSRQTAGFLRLHSTLTDSKRTARLAPACLFMGDGGEFDFPPSTFHPPLAPPFLSF